MLVRFLFLLFVLSNSHQTNRLFFFVTLRSQRAACHKGRQFLDVEADLSEEGEEEVSSDEDDGEELNCSLDGFVVNNTECSQGLNGKTSMWLLVETRLNLLD